MIATVQKIVTEILPPSSGLAFGKDARDLLIECCVEFITLISSEANEISEKESKKTIACEHITKALEQLGFGEYVPDIMEVASEHKEQLKVCILSIFPGDVVLILWNRDERKRQINLNKAVCQQSNFSQCKKKPLEMQRNAMDDMFLEGSFAWALLFSLRAWFLELGLAWMVALGFPSFPRGL